MNRSQSSVRIRPVAAVLGLLAGLSLSGAASAATFTMAELFQNPDGFTIGETKFFSFTPASDPPGPGDVNPNLVLVETVENSSLLGFTVSGPFNGDSSFNYNFQVVQQDLRVINAASLWVSDLGSVDGLLSISERECDTGPTGGGADDCNPVGNPRPDLLVERTLTELNLIDADLFMPSQGSGDVFRIRTELTTTGSLELNRYAQLFSVVPEPGTGLLFASGLIGLAWTGRRRRH